MVRVVLFGCLAFLPAQAEVYCFGFLNAHLDRKEIPKIEADEIQKAHLAHMGKMSFAGRLLAAGPMATSGGPRGIVLYRCKSIEEAEGWTALDPAVLNKRLSTEFYRWLGPEGFGEPLMTMLKSDPQANYQMVRLPLIVLKKTEKWAGQGPPEVLSEHGIVLDGLLKTGTLRAAGPFVDEQGRWGFVPGVAGLLLFKAMPLAEAKAIADRDPLVREGYVRVDGMEWYVADEAVPKPPSAGSGAPR